MKKDTYNYFDHTSFGGQIYRNDFDRKTTLSEITARILSDRNFDNECMRNRLNKEGKPDA